MQDLIAKVTAEINHELAHQWSTFRPSEGDDKHSISNPRHTDLGGLVLVRVSIATSR